VHDQALRRLWSYRPFYRQYPYDRPVHIQAADRHGAVDCQYGFFYNRIPKCANSTIVQTLVTCSGVIGPGAGREAKRAFMKPHALPAGLMAAFRNEWFKFTFVRNPYARLLSAYLDKIVRKGYAHRRRYRALLEPGKDATSPPSLDRFLDFLAAEGLYANVHWAPQTAMLLIPEADFDFIGKVESLDKDLAFVLQRIFPDHPGGEDRKIGRAGPPPTGAQDKVHTMLNRRQMDRIAQLYERDITALGYAFM